MTAWLGAGGWTAAAIGALCVCAAAAGPADRDPRAAAKVELGHQLFYDADLSIDGTMACATCHEQRRGFTDGNRTHPGVHGDPGRRNIMALANVGDFGSFTWGDPGVRSLEAQALIPIQGVHPVEMGMAGQEAVLASRLGADACNRQMFAAAFPGSGGAVSMQTITQALAAFERTLTSSDSPYDRVRRGDRSALTPAARRGEALFFDRMDCASCHAGPDFTDAARPGADPVAAFHDIGLHDRGVISSGDGGLREITSLVADEGRFRTPSLRNVALTAPYLHDGSAATLDEAIRRHRLGSGATASPDETSDLVAFLSSLTDRRFVTDPRYALPRTRCGEPR